MTNYTIDLQLFAAGDAVMGTDGYINANTGAKDSYGAGGLSPEMKTFYDKTLITLAGANLVHEQFGQKRPIPAGSGRTVEFRRFSSLPKALTPITEGVTPAGNKLTVRDVFRAAAELKAMNAPKIDGYYVAIIHPYVAYDLMQEAGDEWIDIAKYASPDTILTGEIGRLAGIRFVESSEAKIFAPRVIAAGKSRLKVRTSNTTASASVVVNETLPAMSGVDIPIYVGGASNSITAITMNGALTTLTLAIPIKCSAGDIISGRGAGYDGSAVLSTVVLGADAFGVTDVENGGIEHIVKQKGYGNDPLNQRSSIGWKALATAEILVDEYIVRIESGSSYSAIAEAN